MDVELTKSKRKKNCCLYCSLNFANIAKHLETAHKDEDEVKKFTILPKGCKERKEIIDMLRKKGNFDSNRLGDKIIPVRLPKQNADVTLMPCPRCRGYYSKTGLRKHYKICQSAAPSGTKRLMVLSRFVGQGIHKSASETLRRILSHLRDDEVSKIVRHDPLIISYGNKLVKKLTDSHHSKEIRAKLRHLGRLLLTIRKIEPEITDFASIFNPKHYNSCLQAANQLAGIKYTDNKFDKPAVALSTGTLLKKVGKHMKSFLIMNAMIEKQATLEQFMHLLHEDYGTAINKTALENITEVKRNKTVKLPIMEDLSKFYKFLCSKRQEHYERCKQHQFSYAEWKRLSGFTLLSVLVFNRRRPGETERLLVSDFDSAKSVSYKNDKELFSYLDITEKEAAKEYLLIPLRGKLNRSVHILVDKKSYKCLKAVVKLRKNAGVSKHNPYVFGLPGGDPREYRHLDACALMRFYSDQCGLKNPETLRATLLRKHLATQCSVIGLKADEVSDVANHLGHAENIHLQIYRQSVPTREITKMSKLLQSTLETPSTVTDSTETENTSPSTARENTVQSYLDSTESSVSYLEDEMTVSSEVVISNTNLSSSSGDEAVMETFEDNWQSDAVNENSDSFRDTADKISSCQVLLTPLKEPEIYKETNLLKEARFELEKQATGELDSVELSTIDSDLLAKQTEQVIEGNEQPSGESEPPLQQKSEQNQLPLELTEQLSQQTKLPLEQTEVPLQQNELQIQQTQLSAELEVTELPLKQTELQVQQTQISAELEVTELPLKQAEVSFQQTELSIQHPQLPSEKAEPLFEQVVLLQADQPVKQGELQLEKEETLEQTCQQVEQNTEPACTSSASQNIRKGNSPLSDFSKSESEYQTSSDSDVSSDVSTDYEMFPRTRGRKKIKRNWTTPEKAILKHVFNDNLKEKTMPSSKTCNEVVSEYPDLEGISGAQARRWLSQKIQKNKDVGELETVREKSPDDEKIKRVSWTTPEKKLVRQLFQNYIEQLKLPRFVMCKKAVKTYPQFSKRTDKQLYAYINNQIQRLKRNPRTGISSPENKIKETVLRTPEKRVVRKLFSKHINEQDKPDVEETTEIMMKHPILRNKKVNAIKNIVDHEIERKEFTERVTRQKKNLVKHL